MEYSLRLSFLLLHSLERRCQTANFILTYIIIFRLVEANMADNLVFFTKDDCTTTHGNPNKLFVNYCLTNKRKIFLSERIV